MTPDATLNPQQHLFIADDFALPLDITVEKTAILGRSGSGKTNTSTALVEELLSAKQQVVIIDPPGAWWGLRSSADGQRDGYPIVIFGGEHADIELEPEQGAAIATLIVDQRISAVLDLSDFSLSAISRFGRDFAKQLYEHKSRNRDPMLLVVEEADELIPQQPQPNQTECLAAFERIAKRGRMRGIGGLQITQRSASLNKNVLSQVALLIAMQTTDPRDRDAIDNWIKLNCSTEQRQQLLSELASLPQGTGFLIWPQRSIFERLAFRRRKTFDSSATPTPGQTITEPATLATINLDAIRQLLGSTEKTDKSPTDHPKTITKLKAHIHNLEAQLAGQPDTAQLKRDITDYAAENIELRAENQRLQATITANEQNTTQTHITILSLITALGNATAAAEHLQNSYTPTNPNNPAINLVKSPHAEDHTTPDAKPTKITTKPTKEHDPLTYTLRDGERRIMETVALWHGAGINRLQLATLAGLSHSSGSFGTYLSNLQKCKIIQATPTGYVPGPSCPLDSAGSLPTHDQLMDLWTKRLKPSIARMLKILEQHPKGLTRPQLAALMTMSASSGSFGQYIAELKKNQLTETTKTHIKPSRYLWPEEPK